MCVVADFKKYINKDLPEFQEREDSGGFRVDYPQYEDFLRNIVRAAEVERIPEYKKKIASALGADTRLGIKNEPTSFEKILASMGISKDYLDQLHYRTINPEKLGRTAIENKIADLYMQATQPEARQNVKFRDQLDTKTYNEYYEKEHGYDPMAQENLNYYKKMAEDVVGIPLGKIKPTEDRSIAGEYDPKEDTISYSPAYALTGYDPSALAHELMHKKEMQGKTGGVSSEDLSIDFRKGNKVNLDQESNRGHIGLPLNIDTSNIDFKIGGPQKEDVINQAPTGQRPVFFNALKKLLNKEK